MFQVHIEKKKKNNKKINVPWKYYNNLDKMYIYKKCNISGTNWNSGNSEAKIPKKLWNQKRRPYKQLKIKTFKTFIYLFNICLFFVSSIAFVFCLSLRCSRLFPSYINLSIHDHVNVCYIFCFRNWLLLDWTNRSIALLLVFVCYAV